MMPIRDFSRVQCSCRPAEQGNDLVGRAGHQQAIELVGAQKTLSGHVCKEYEQVFIVGCGVEHCAGFYVERELLPCEDLEELVHGSDAAGHRHKCVSQGGHGHLALVHVGDADEFGQAVVGEFARVEGVWDHSHHRSTGLKNGVRNCTHEAGFAATVDQPDPRLCNVFPELERVFPVGLVVSRAGTAIDADALNREGLRAYA